MNVYVLNTLCIGLDTMDLVRKRLPIQGVIGLSERDSSDSISDYVYQSRFCKDRGLDFIEVSTYGLTANSDRCALLELEIDVLVVMGWQRLIPKWLIEHCKICSIGSHGSPLGITKGRGRSPQNWALILGMDSFEISIFEIDAGVDSGRIIDSRKFSYSPYDDIKTSYYKVSLLTSEMIADALMSPTFCKLDFDEQAHEEAEYFPQRTPSDGAIDWQCTNQEISRFVRALTKPYPGAHTYAGKQQLRIWSAIPFDIDVRTKCTPGEVYKVFNNQDLLVKSGHGYVLIQDYELSSGAPAISEGLKLESHSFSQQIKSIIKKHEAKHPEFPIASEVKKYDES